ncbi:MAG TPA: hypothetical protein VMB18_02700 [Terriglobales bacterium]|nr:hypothetical protein [Terriglobales bacterium]
MRLSSKRTWRSLSTKFFNGRVSLSLLFLLVAIPAFASGGSCPSGAAYLNPSTNTLVTLSSLGVTNCYYVAANGSDSNNGTSEASPWQHAPFMPNCSGKCATVTTQSASLWPGTGIIFRGGDTWHFGNSGATPYTGGTWEWNTGTTPSGTLPGSPIYLGFDTSWYSGSSWARPIFNADNPACNATTANGSTCISTTDWYGQPSYYVTSCQYQIGSTNDFFDVSWVHGFIIDNFEMTGLCQSDVGQPAHHDNYFSYGSAQGPDYFQNNYLHGASHLQFAAKNGDPGCSSSTVCTNIFAFDGSVNNGSVGETVTYNVVDFSDSDPGGEGLCFAGFYNVAYNVFRYTTNCLPNPLHLFHDNLYEYFFENGHSNMIEDVGESTGANAIYDNVFRHVENDLSTGGGVALWFAPPTSGTVDYIFNNVVYDVGALEYLNIGGTAGNNALGNYTFFNNTFQTNISQPILRCNLYTNGPVIDTNNHYIDNQNYILGPCSTLTSTTPLLMSNSTATKDGYTSSETFAYSPTASNSPTVGTGTNEYSGYCSALSTAGLTAAATACQSDVTYACSYAGNGAPPVCPARTVTARPQTGAWDIGAYEFDAQDPPPNAPTGLTAVVQ